MTDLNNTSGSMHLNIDVPLDTLTEEYISNRYALTTFWIPVLGLATGTTFLLIPNSDTLTRSIALVLALLSYEISKLRPFLTMNKIATHLSEKVKRLEQEEEERTQ